VVADTVKSVHPNEVGLLLSRKIGTREAEVRNRRIRFRDARRRVESEELQLLDVIAINNSLSCDFNEILKLD
jgi:ribonuclease P protein component